MTIAILETGRPPGDLPELFGDYPAMFRGLIGDDFDYRTFRVFEGEFPDDPAAFEALLITGSPAGVYDDLPWIAPLEELVRASVGKTKLVGVCFGHQVMASALGGEVVKSPKGWGVGLHTYEITGEAAWTDGAQAISVPVSHQDQVVSLPTQARVLGGNDFCPYGVLEYSFGGISMQCHPEFSPDYDRALLERRRHRYDRDEFNAAMLSLDRPNDNERVAGWIRRFLRP
jgi:GMP synthase-like glutamine amidotransferase